jgi:hypothetical protein
VPYPGLAMLYGVTAVSARSAWTVGYGFTHRGAENDRLIAHWNGRAWKQVPSPGGGFLDSVTAVSAHSAWAVGSRSFSTPSR